MSELTIPGVAAHLICKGGIVLMTVLLGQQTGGAGMPAAAVAPTIDRSVTRASDASAASSVTAAALIGATLIACLDLDTHDLDNRGLVGSLHTVGPDLGSLVGGRQTVGPDSGSCHSMVGWILGLRPESGWRRFIDCCICWICVFKS
jgi:hypothetical protein